MSRTLALTEQRHAWRGVQGRRLAHSSLGWARWAWYAHRVSVLLNGCSVCSYKLMLFHHVCGVCSYTLRLQYYLTNMSLIKGLPELQEVIYTEISEKRPTLPCRGRL